MSESTKTRTYDEVSQEYQQGCLRAGHLQYQISALSKDLDILNESLRNLNLEANDIKVKSAPAATAESGAANVA
jgi:hypothetical protein